MEIPGLGLSRCSSYLNDQREEELSLMRFGEQSDEVEGEGDVLDVVVGGERHAPSHAPLGTAFKDPREEEEETYGRVIRWVPWLTPPSMYSSKGFRMGMRLSVC